jgi:hypothetical protein
LSHRHHEENTLTVGGRSTGSDGGADDRTVLASDIADDRRRLRQVEVALLQHRQLACRRAADTETDLISARPTIDANTAPPYARKKREIGRQNNMVQAPSPRSRSV